MRAPTERDGREPVELPGRPPDGVAPRAEPVVGPRRRVGPLGLVAAGWVGLVVVASLIAPLLPLADPTAADGAARQAPSFGHLFGTDGIGRDVLARVIWGGRASLVVGVGAVVVGTVIGGALGLVAGYHRGRVEGLLAGLFDTMLSVPPIVLASTLVAVLGTGPGVTPVRRTVLLVVALAFVMVPIVGRITRASTLSWCQRDFVHMALAVGSPPRRVLVHEVLPNVVPSVLSFALVAVGYLVVIEGSLSLLGVGVALPTPSWGNIIAEGHGALRYGAVHLVVFPALMIFLTVLALNHLGDVARDGFDVRGTAL